VIDRQLDTRLRDLSSHLFRVDDESRKIVSEIARRGPCTIYELQPKLPHANIYRRLRGEGRKVSLLKEQYLRQEETAEFKIPGIKKQYLGLTLKGFLAALSNVRADNIYMFKIFLETGSVSKPY